MLQSSGWYIFKGGIIYTQKQNSEINTVKG